MILLSLLSVDKTVAFDISTRSIYRVTDYSTNSPHWQTPVVYQAQELSPQEQLLPHSRMSKEYASSSRLPLAPRPHYPPWTLLALIWKKTQRTFCTITGHCSSFAQLYIQMDIALLHILRNWNLVNCSFLHYSDTI
ncbi:hypothetical protein DPEC_G00058560 [Dallia pectoralis]|uniref:Uncharacterized protein n=1 Tax=Dallia pectoralis TaxID=75939 RepID=A0ACC2H642_DALPE|nr:hypothetical protein DPEC_G00058560 [Dallia pectoralis]